ncbi:MAG: hypothetical protein ACREB3_00610 [Burkholderiales bacterium]
MIITVNSETINVAPYLKFHRVRIANTLATLKAEGVRRVIELGGHPWAFTAALLGDPSFELLATVSAEEICRWPDTFAPARREYSLTLEGGRNHTFPNYSANLERGLFGVEERAEGVIACEIIEHLVRAPHVMLLNINHWLPVGGKLVITTPNGAQFFNPLRVKSPSPGYRSQIYERHHHVYTMEQLVDLVSCCGFRVKRAEYWDPYPRTGPRHLYGMLASLPARYLHAKFRHTLFITAEKSEHLEHLPRKPAVLVGDGWEHVQTRAG